MGLPTSVAIVTEGNTETTAEVAWSTCIIVCHNLSTSNFPLEMNGQFERRKIKKSLRVFKKEHSQARNWMYGYFTLIFQPTNQIHI